MFQLQIDCLYEIKFCKNVELALKKKHCVEYDQNATSSDQAKCTVFKIHGYPYISKN